MIESRRLKLIPLNLDMLDQYLALDGSLEESLELIPYPRTITDDLHSALKHVIIPRVRMGIQDFHFSTIWTAIHKEKRVMVGDICFKGKPDGMGRVELGYGTYPDFQQQGYMSEMVEAMSAWAFAQPKVRVVLAETREDNKASQRVLANNGFVHFETKLEMMWWKLVKGKD
ncbi:MAG: GNAT family N-acetyltransferase [Saprospiraceae bacterium]|nr:GNAT family N-acetyltransferase [Saprospiraceae bacterium]